MEKELENKYKKIALKALEQFDIEYEYIDFLVEETNIFFEVFGKDHVVLKIFQEESSKTEDNLIEDFFLDEIAKRTEIVVPYMIPSKNGDKIVFIESEDFDTLKRVALYNYVEGKDLDGNETRELFEELGKVTAKLHLASKEIKIPKEMEPKKWDKVFYYREEVPIFHNKKYAHIFSKEDLTFLDQFIAYLDLKLPTYYKEESYLIHADLNPWNVKIHEGEIRLLDFEEGMLGCALHDIAIMLFYYRYDTNYNYQEIKESYLKGYKSLNKLSDFTDFDIDLLIMARTTNFINYTLLIHEDPKDYIQERIKRIKDFIRNYNIQL